ncbi:hypothetical protein HUC00_29170 (plasmid) [Bacillus mycoides]|nr:hypothetical protein [Bacillus mycoides]
MKMKYEDLSDFGNRRNTFDVGDSGSGFSRSMDFSPEKIYEILKARKETNKEHQNGKNQGK